MATQFRAFAFAIAVGVICLSSFEVRAEGGAAPVQAALGGLESWLGDGANGKTWSAYLNLPSLHAELAKGEKADPAAIAAVQKKLESGAAGLELGPFAKLRNSLALWSEELAIAGAPGLPEATLQAEAAFRPISDADLAADKTALEAAVAKLDRYLKSGGANGAAWREYLRWKDLEAQLKADKPDVDTLKSVSQRFAADQVGLELPVYADVAAPLERYLNDLTASKEDLKTQYATQLKTLSEELKQYAAGQNDELALGLGDALAGRSGDVGGARLGRTAGLAGEHAASDSVGQRHPQALLATESARSRVASPGGRGHRPARRRSHAGQRRHPRHQHHGHRSHRW